MGKSFLKGLKYAGLYLGAGALGALAQPEVVSGALIGALTGVGAPAVAAVLVGQYAVPVLVSVLAGATQQVIKHKDKVFGNGDENG